MNVIDNESRRSYKWLIETLDIGLVGEYACQVLESKDKAHIAYFDHKHGDLKCAHSGPNGWTLERADRDGTVGQYLSMTMDKAGRLYLSYRDQGKNKLKMALFDGNIWRFEYVDDEPFASFDTSICVDSSERVYISYFNFSQGYLKLATREHGQWRREIVDDGAKKSKSVGSFTCARLDSFGRVHLSYIDSDNGLLKYAVKENGYWHIETADDCEFVGNFTSMALDQEGNPYISYTVDKAPNKPDLWLARKMNGQWINELVDSQRIAGNYSSIVLDPHENIYISYSAMSKLKLATWKGGQWAFEVIDPEGTATYTSLSLDEDGMPHIAYHDKERGVKYARRAAVAESTG